MTEGQRRVCELARAWEGASFWDAGYGASPFCASFVRYIYEKALGELGRLPLVSRPPHYQTLGLTYPVGVWFADSMAGDEVGPSVALSLVQPGDLLFFVNTYPGWAEGTITHIGIALDSLGLMADAGGGGIIYVRDHLATFPGLFIEARRPRCLGNVPKRTLIELTPTGPHALWHGEKVFTQEMTVTFALGSLVVTVNDKPIQRKHITALIDIPGKKGFAKLFAHDGKVAAYKNGKAAALLSIKARLDNGALHVWVDDKEIKPTHFRLEGVGLVGT